MAPSSTTALLFPAAPSISQRSTVFDLTPFFPFPNAPYYTPSFFPSVLCTLCSRSLAFLWLHQIDSSQRLLSIHAAAHYFCSWYSMPHFTLFLLVFLCFCFFFHPYPSLPLFLDHLKPRSVDFNDDRLCRLSSVRSSFMTVTRH